MVSDDHASENVKKSPRLKKFKAEEKPIQKEAKKQKNETNVSR